MNIRELLSPYASELSDAQVVQVSDYVSLLLRWNAKMNLTAVREPEEIVKRHFGESFYLARYVPVVTNGVLDVGSGAGFPGIPLKIARPWLTLTLIEAQQKKATFLREVLRSLRLEVEVRNARAEDLVGTVSADLVTMRAVEKFSEILPVAARLARKGSGGLGLLIGSAQETQVRKELPGWEFRAGIAIPGSQNRVILMGNQAG
jgi:16S rRNA (guanine527-N7)-methyltransferase